MRALVPIIIVLAIVGLIVYAVIAKRKREQAMAALALQQGWTPLGNDAGTLSQYLPQYLQNLGDSQEYDMAYQANVDGVPLVFFQYLYTEHVERYDPQTGTNQRTSSTSAFTVVHAQLSKTFPNVLLLHHSLLSKLGSLTQRWGMQQLSLEGDFNKYFDSYIAPGTQVEALALLAPDVMAGLIDNTKNASLQFNGTSMIVSIETTTLSAKTIMPLLASVLAIIKKVEDKPQPLSTPPQQPATPESISNVS